MRTGLEGRVAVITGAASGIGLATARRFAQEGSQIVAADLVGTSPSYAAEWHQIAVDVSQEDAGERLITAALERYGRVDVLVTCAGVFDSTPLMDVDPGSFEEVQSINVRGTFVCARSAIQAMARNGWGRIVLLSSIAAHTGGTTAGPAYVASKSAVLGLTRALALVAGPFGITVNCVNPGLIETPMTALIPEATKRESAARTPLRRNGTPDDVASVIVMMSSEATGFVTGAHLDVSGGLTMT